MNFGSLLSAALTTGTQAADAQQQGEAEARATQAQGLQTQLQLLRQQKEQEIRDALISAQTGEAKARTTSLLAPVPKAELVVPQGSTVLGVDRKPTFTSPKPVVKTPRTFMEDGKPVEGTSDTEGNFYHTDGTKATGAITPYEKAEPKDKSVVLTENPSDPQGPGVYTPREKAVGQAAPGKPKAENAMNVAATARLTAAVSEMNNAHTGMGSYEEKLRNGTASINGLQQFAGAVANSFTHDDPASRAAQSAALTVLNNTNPDLARYIRRGLSFAEGESMITQRPSDFRTKMAAFLSTAASGASPEMIQDIQSRRTSILNPLNDTVKPAKKPANGGLGGGAGNQSLSAEDAAHAARDPAFAEWLRTHGHTAP